MKGLYKQIISSPHFPTLLIHYNFRTYSILIFHKMDQQIEDALATSDRTLIHELFLKNQLLAQIQYALGRDHFNHFVSAFQLIKVKQSTAFQLKTSAMYFFFSDGTIIQRKGTKELQSLSSKTSFKKKNNSEVGESKNGHFLTEHISKGSSTSIQNLLQATKKTFALFTPSFQKGALLRVSALNCQNSVTKIKEYMNSKFKFINRFQIFQSFCFNQLQNHLKKFILRKFSFNQTIYCKERRKNSVYFLLEGQVVLESAQVSKRLILRAPNMIGYQKENEDQRVKCITEKCVLYELSDDSLNHILDENDNSQRQKLTLSFLRKQYFFSEKQKQQQNIQMVSLSNDCLKKPLTQSKKKHKKLITSQISDAKKQQLREHFSNFMNERYEEYSIKKSNGIDFTQQQPILYEIKPLQPKFPDFTEMNTRLKRMRIRKIAQSKNLFIRTKSSEHILHLNSYESGQSQNIFTNDRLSHKILKGIERKINMKIGKENPYLMVKKFS